MCEEKEINFTVIFAPVYSSLLEIYTQDTFSEFKNKLASVTPYWDFSCSSVSYDPRYFYDLTDCRNALGTMVLGRVFGNNDIYIPDGFGKYVERGSFSMKTNIKLLIFRITPATYLF